MADPVFDATSINYFLLTLSFIFILPGSILCWQDTASVTVDDKAKRAADYFIIGFFYIFLCASAIVISRRRGNAARPISGAIYLILAGLVFEVITRNQIISFAYGNLWRIYTKDTSRMDSNPTDKQKTAVKALLAGVIMGHIGSLLAVIGASIHKNQNFSIRGTYTSLLGWVFSIPGIVVLLTSGVCTLETVNSNTSVYQTAWLIVDTTIGILLIQTVGILFDIYELVAASVVIGGTHGVFILGDMLQLDYLRSLSDEYSNQQSRVYAGGILCAISIVISLIGSLLFLRKRLVQYSNI